MKLFLDKLILYELNPDEVRARKSSVALFELQADFRFNSGVVGPITVPAGLVTDFASIPRIAWRYISPDDPGISYGSVPHDYLYNCHGTLPDGRTYSREQADQVLREAMQDCGARTDQVFAVYWAVHLFGGGHWP